MHYPIGWADVVLNELAIPSHFESISTE